MLTDAEAKQQSEGDNGLENGRFDLIALPLDDERAGAIGEPVQTGRGCGHCKQEKNKAKHQLPPLSEDEPASAVFKLCSMVVRAVSIS